MLDVQRLQEPSAVATPVFVASFQSGIHDFLLVTTGSAETIAGMGHSAAFLEAKRWAEKIISGSGEGIHATLSFTGPSWPVAGSKRAPISSPERNSLDQAQNPKLEALLNRMGSVRTIYIEEGETDHRVSSPRTWRLGYRKSLKTARSMPSGSGSRLPFLARHIDLYVKQPVNETELTIQLLLIFAQWGWADDANDDDRRYIVRYMSSLFRNAGKMRQAIEESVSFLFTNFVMPQNAGDFRLYIRRMVHDVHRRKRKGIEGIPIDPEFDVEKVPSKPDEENGMPTDPAVVTLARDYVSPTQLATERGMRHQRIYEAIDRHDLQAERWHGYYRITRSEADRFRTIHQLSPANRQLSQLIRETVRSLRASGNAKKVAAFA